jgi:hypothetical protein
MAVGNVCGFVDLLTIENLDIEKVRHSVFTKKKIVSKMTKASFRSSSLNIATAAKDSGHWLQRLFTLDYVIT